MNDSLPDRCIVQDRETGKLIVCALAGWHLAIQTALGRF